MANAKRELEYDIARQVVVYFNQMWNGQLPPHTANPYRNLDSIKTPEQKKDEAKEGWGILKAGLKLMNSGRVNR